MRKWSNKLKRVIKEQKAARGKSINLAIVTANNHYAGFGPETANIFRKMICITSIIGKELTGNMIS
jgi:hypothetical protein